MFNGFNLFLFIKQVLNFEQYKMRGWMYLDKAFTERLLEQLEDAQALLAQMLTSRYIGPLREEAASWAEKLKEVRESLYYTGTCSKLNGWHGLFIYPRDGGTTFFAIVSKTGLKTPL